MPEAIIDKEVCAKCGVDVREDTQFCYNCGGPVAAVPATDATTTNGEETPASDETQAALDDLAEKLRADDAPEGDKLAIAAAARKKARVSKRQVKKVRWEPREDDLSAGWVLMAAVIVTVIVAIVVVLTVVWK
jgi:flagellar biosynthesis/type III secretory pathway M-ring protein FliF/YscJ